MKKNPTEIFSVFDDVSSYLYDQFYAAGSNGGILADGKVSQLAKDVFAGRISRKDFMEEEAREHRFPLTKEFESKLEYDEEDDEEVDDYDDNEEEKWDWD